MACVYKIICKDNSITDCYVGSTTDFRRRRKCHKNNVYNPKDKRYNLKVYKFIRENGGWDNWNMIKIEDCEVENKFKLERKYYDELKPTLNSKCPFVTNEQRKIKKSITSKKYYLKNQDKLVKMGKKYYLKNKDKVVKRCKEYSLKNKDAINKRKQEWYIKNKDTVNKKNKAYYLKNKDAINKKKRERYAKKKLQKK